MERRVVATGAGVLSPLGNSAGELHAALVAGRCALGPLTRFEAPGADGLRVGQLDFDAPALLGAERNLRPLDRLSQMVAAAAQLALADAGWDAERLASHDVGLVLGTMLSGLRTIAEFDRRGLTRGPSYVSPFDFANTVLNASAGQAAIWHQLRGVNSTVCAAQAAALQAIGQAADVVRSGAAVALLAGGAEELSYESFTGFRRSGWLCAAGNGARPVPFDTRRGGCALSEGAGLVVLEEAEGAAARGAHVMGEVLGWGSAYDASRGTDARGAAYALERAVRAALEQAGAAPAEIDAVSSGANGGVLGDAAEAEGIARALGPRAAGLPVLAVKSALGEALGASGALQAIDLLAAMSDGRLAGVAGLEKADPALALRPLAASRPAPVRRALVTAAGLDGACAALVLGAAS